MKFTCKTINLREAIQKVEHIVSKQTTLPILGNVLISTDKGRILLAATNLEIAIKVHLGAKIEKEGQITIPARMLSGFLNTIKDDVVFGEVDDSELKITSKNHKIKIKGLDAKDFPIIPETPNQIFFSLNPIEFQKAIGVVLVSVARNDTRQELNGILMKFENDKIICASTDSFRLSETTIKINPKSQSREFEIYREKNPSIIIPAQAFIELQRVIGENEEIQFVVDQNQLFVISNSTKIVSRLINGNYPEYQQVLPKKYDIEVKIKKEDLSNAVKIASLVANNQNGEVQIKSSKDNKKLIISAQSIDTGDNISRIKADIIGNNFSIIFNCRYLLEGLGSIMFEGEDIVLKLNQQKSPVLLRSIEKEKENNKYSYIIMPIIKG